MASHPFVAECCIVGLPDELKGHVPFAMITRAASQEAQKADLDKVLKEVNDNLRNGEVPIASAQVLLLITQTRRCGQCGRTRWIGSFKTTKNALRQDTEENDQGLGRKRYSREIRCRSTLPSNNRGRNSCG